MDVLEVVVRAAITKLTADSTLNTLVGSRFFLNTAPPPLIYPYVLMSYGRGGLLNDSPHDAAEIELMISGVSTSGVEAQTIAGYIFSDLHKQLLTYPETWVDWDTVKQIDPFARELTTQNAEYFQFGAYYRFRIKRGN